MQSPFHVKEREQRAVAMYKLWSEKGLTFEKIGLKYGLTKQRVGKIVHKYIHDKNIVQSK